MDAPNAELCAWRPATTRCSPAPGRCSGCAAIAAASTACAPANRSSTASSAGTLPPGCRVAAGGGIAHRPGIDNPYDLLIPTNRLIATSTPHTVGIARCECGVYGCGATDVTIRRGPGVVHWDWSAEVPMSRGASFPADRYDIEVARIAADHAWETPERTAARLILTGVDHQQLRAQGLRPIWAANDYRDHTKFLFALQLDNDYQVFLSLPWRSDDPQTLAHRALATLATPPETWSATWHAIKPTLTAPPPIAGPSWQRYQH